MAALVVILAVESALRLADVRALIPYAWGLEEYDSAGIRLREFGPPDLLIFGSSRARESFDLPTLSAALPADPTQPLSVGNYALSGARAGEARAVLELALRRGQPRLVLLGVSPRLLQGRAEFRDRQARFWSAQETISALWRQNEPTLAAIAARTQLGVAIRTLRYRDRLSTCLDDALASLQQGEGLAGARAALRLRPIESPQAGGRTLFQQESPDVSLITRPVPDSWIGAALERIEEEGQYELTSERADTLRVIIRLCRTAGVELLLFEIPMSRQLVRLLPMGTMDVFRHAMRGLSEEENVPWIQLEQLGLVFEDADFFEPSHLNRVGAQKLTRGLCEQVLLPRLRSRQR